MEQDTYQEPTKEYIIKLPQHTNFEIKAFHEFFRTLSRILKNVPFAFTLSMVNKRIFYGVQIPERYHSIMENQIYSVFPKVEVEEVSRNWEEGSADKGAKAVLSLKLGDQYPFLSYEQMEGSFLSDFFNQFISAVTFRFI